MMGPLSPSLLALPEAADLGAPITEFTRSPAATRVAYHAAAMGLRLFHYEHRCHLPLPTEWTPPKQSELGEPPEWNRGILAESKYQSFRHDLVFGGFNPNHRAKWAAHELCHGLVGFGWNPHATPLFHATAGRLAEVVPVALWYFLDEAWLKRCPTHTEGGALFRSLCSECEQIAAVRSDDPRAAAHVADARRFVDRELAAVVRSRRLGRPIPHQWATLDLCSDGIAYARAHSLRLASPLFAWFAENFLVPDGPCAPDLDTMIARVEAVFSSLVDGTPLSPFVPSPRAGRARWTVQDIAWRLLQISALADDDETADILEPLVRSLAEAIPHTTPTGTPQRAEQTIADVGDQYRERLSTTDVLPPFEVVFGLGYPSPAGHGCAYPQMKAGIASATPLCAMALADQLGSVVQQFAKVDLPTRTPLAHRWANWLCNQVGGPLADLAVYEAALTTIPDRPSEPLTGPASDGRLRLASGMQLHTFEHHVVEIAERVESGDLDGKSSKSGPVLTDAEGNEPERREHDDPFTLLMGRNDTGETVIVELPMDDATALKGSHVDSLPEPTKNTLCELGALVPATLAELAPAEDDSGL